MLLSQSFSSLIENNNSALNNTAADLLNGLKILHDNQWYICGNLALNEGQAPHKLINSSPADLDYQLLIKAAMLLVADTVEQPVTITTGFPYATYRIYKDIAIEQLRKTHIIEYDSSTFGGSGKKTVILDVKNVDVIPEIVACSIALRKGEEKASGNFFILSCGFGTFESVLSMDSGVVEQTMISTHGLRYAINYMINELSKTHYLGFRTAHTLDEAFQRGYLYIDKKNIDVREIRKNALRSYYNEVISPNLRNVITDKNLTKTNKVYLCGGGMYYQDLIECFKNEFGEIVQLEVVSDPAALASKGYTLNSLRVSGGLQNAAVGIDIGNSTTVVTRISGE
ncbi:MAG TPA: ParM/StbA family protein [Mucilaginibacter sp.]